MNNYLFCKLKSILREMIIYWKQFQWDIFYKIIVLTQSLIDLHEYILFNEIYFCVSLNVMFVNMSTTQISYSQNRSIILLFSIIYIITRIFYRWQNVISYFKSYQQNKNFYTYYYILFFLFKFEICYLQYITICRMIILLYWNQLQSTRI